MRSAHRLMLVNICLRFHEGVLNGFWVTERTRPYRKIYYFQFQRATTPKIHNPVMVLALCRLSHVALHLCKVSWKYLESFLSYRADTILWQTDGQGKNNMSPNPMGGDIITLEIHSNAHYYFYFPPQTPILLYKWEFEAVSFTRSCSHDEPKMKAEKWCMSRTTVPQIFYQCHQVFSFYHLHCYTLSWGLWAGVHCT